MTDPNVYSAGSVLYDSLAKLEAASRQARAMVELRDPPRCASCATPAILRAADYHAFHSERGLDLVLRWATAAGPPSRLWWDGDAYLPAATLSDDDEWCVTGDALLRRAAVRIEVEGLAEAIGDIIVAQEEVPGDRELLTFLPPLLDAGYVDLATAILEGYVGQRPEDEAAAMLLDSLRGDG